jgi:hypothetical protein
MAAEPIITALEMARVERFHRGRAKALADYWALTKPEVNFLIAITTFAGFCLARPIQSDPFPFMLLIHTLLGTLLVAGGTGTLNQYLERRFDAQMRRTARRPVASGRIESSHALWFGISLSLDYVRLVLPKLLNRFATVGSLCHQLHIGLAVDDGHNPFLQQRVVIYGENTDTGDIVHLTYLPPFLAIVVSDLAHPNYDLIHHLSGPPQRPHAAAAPHLAR